MGRLPGYPTATLWTPSWSTIWSNSSTRDAVAAAILQDQCSLGFDNIDVSDVEYASIVGTTPATMWAWLHPKIVSYGLKVLYQPGLAFWGLMGSDQGLTEGLCHVRSNESPYTLSDYPSLSNTWSTVFFCPYRFFTAGDYVSFILSNISLLGPDYVCLDFEGMVQPAGLYGVALPDMTTMIGGCKYCNGVEGYRSGQRAIFNYFAAAAVAANATAKTWAYSTYNADNVPLLLPNPGPYSAVKPDSFFPNNTAPVPAPGFYPPPPGADGGDRLGYVQFLLEQVDATNGYPWIAPFSDSDMTVWATTDLMYQLGQIFARAGAGGISFFPGRYTSVLGQSADITTSNATYYQLISAALSGFRSIQPIMPAMSSTIEVWPRPCSIWQPGKP